MNLDISPHASLVSFGLLYCCPFVLSLISVVSTKHAQILRFLSCCGLVADFSPSSFYCPVPGLWSLTYEHLHLCLSIFKGEEKLLHSAQSPRAMPATHWAYVYTYLFPSDITIAMIFRGEINFNPAITNMSINCTAR